jgi:CrcB protein
MKQLLFVLLGGAVGAPLRVWLGRVILKRWSGPFPLHTLLINVLGSLLLGLLVAATGGEGAVWRLFGTGVLGAFTTFSTFGVEAVTLLERGKTALALTYVLTSALLGVLAAWAGLAWYTEWYQTGDTEGFPCTMCYRSAR